MTTIALIFWFLSGFFCAYFASQRGRDPYAWFAIGFLFSVFGAIALFLLPKKNGEPASDEKPTSDEEIESESTVQAPALDEILLPTEPQWFYLNSSHHQKGPVSFDQLRTLWIHGEIKGETYVWVDGMGNWDKIENLPELHEKLK